jgi:hypothetical protein
MREKVCRFVDQMVMWNLFMFVIHKHLFCESRSSVLTGPPRLSLSDVQTLISDGFSKIEVHL